MTADTLRGFDDPESTPRGSGIARIETVWRRRKWLGILVFILPLTAAAAMIVALPDLYESSALVMVERQQVPEAFVRPTVTSELETRIHSISQEILSRSRLESLVTRMGLYPELKDRAPADEAVNRLRRDVRLELNRADQSRGATTAFTISYRGADPQTVAVVTNTLASFYIEENLKARERQATGTAEFLRVQLVDVKKRLDEQEARNSELQRRYLGELPQQMQGNLAGLESMNAQLRMNNDTVVRLLERRGQLATQLEMARAESGEETDEMRLSRLRRELISLRIKYTDLWPDIIRIKDEIARLEKQIAEPKAKSEPKKAVALTPQALRVAEQLQQTETELKLAKADEQRLKRTIDSFQARLDNAPKREQEYLQATRDYQGTRELYASLTKRFEDAQLAESMEQRQKGEQFRILDAAVIPEEPAGPNRRALIVAGLVLSLGLAVAAAALAEQIDTSFHTTGDLRSFTRVPVLISIPRIVTDGDLRRGRWRFWAAAIPAAAGLALIVETSRIVARHSDVLFTLLSIH